MFELINKSYRLTVRSAEKELMVCLHDLAANFDYVDGPYIYRAKQVCEEGTINFEWLRDMTIQSTAERITITGRLANLDLEHTFTLPMGSSLLEEQITLRNATSDRISLVDFTCGMQRQITNNVGKVLPELGSDRIAAIPFRHKPTDEPEWDNDFTLSDLITFAAREPRVNEFAAFRKGHGWVPSNKRFSEGWAWRRGDYTFCIFKFGQDYMEFSVLATEVTTAGVALRFGGVGMLDDEPSCLRRLFPGQTVQMGKTHFETLKGDYTQACYAFRHFLDDRHCRFPTDYDPPVHWSELHDNPEWSLGSPGKPPQPRQTRIKTYSKDIILKEAAKARDYHCQAIYLDPGWDTEFGTLIWGEEWLGNRKMFIAQVLQEFGLGVSIHTPLATWISLDGRGVQSWPKSAQRMDRNGRYIDGSICLGSSQYLDEAEKRLLENCADGVAYLMFDGNWWNGGCWNPYHGHPVPYTMEDHCRANLDLAKRIHTRFPNVIIEMHDMIAGGSDFRYTPVYYKYGLPGSYDENWGFELMWHPMEDICSGRTRSLYFYNLGCNIPLCIHIDLRDDNEHLLVFWWYASTCRHLGFGGTHENPMVAQAHRVAMHQYRKLERFYKRGEFYGISEEIHAHVLPYENAFVINLFNLSDQSRFISGEMFLKDLGLDCDRWYVNTYGGSFDNDRGCFSIKRRMEPWSAQIAEVHILE